MHRDFSDKNLRGRSFQSQNLEGFSFSRSDIRGADFRHANLKGADFSEAKAGLKPVWIIFLIISSLALAALTGFASGKSGIVASSAFSNEFIQRYTLIPSIVIVLILGAFFLTIIGYGLTVAVINLIWVLSIVWILIWVNATDKAADWSLAFILAFGWSGALGWSGGLAEACLENRTWIWNLTVVIFYVFAGAFADKNSNILYWSAVAIFVWILTTIGANIARKSLNGESKFAFVRSILTVFSTVGGTDFQEADLTEANFENATIKSTNFKKAVLTRTRWFNAHGLERARIVDGYLKYPKVRNLVITGFGENQNYDGLSLKGINLQKTKLVNASFIGADLSKANLQDVDLSRAKLVQTQLDETDLTGATLTGATIEDWGITSHTKLHGVRCEYVFMRLPTEEDLNPHRKPDNWKETFKDGEFADFIKPIVDTLDLYHNQDVDPRAIAIAFKQLAENNPEAKLEIVAMEKRGRDKFLLRANTADTADKSELNQEYFDTYNYLKALSHQDIQLLMAEKDNRIRSLENMVVTALEQPNFYAETYNNQGDTMSDKSSNIKFGNVGGDIGAFAGGNIQGVAGKDITGAAGGDISGTVTTTIGQLQESNAPKAPELADLLKQLQTAIESDKNLSEDDKAEALEQVKALAEAGQSPKEGAMQKTAKTAIRVLKGMIIDLPAVATIVEASQKLLPAIAQIFSLSI
ncbi:MAG TPA: pentapeptide repeat-containing protein [Cyanophyceae cyanobacterium]